MRTSTLAYAGPSYALRPMSAGRSEFGLPSRLKSRPAKMLNGRPLSTDTSELTFRPPAREGSSVSAVIVRRCVTSCRDRAISPVMS